MREILIRIEAPHFVAGIVLKVRGFHVTAPILAYMRGWSLDKIMSYTRSKGWKASIL